MEEIIRVHEENEGFPVPNTSSLKLLMAYKQYLDTIYNIMENISHFNRFYLHHDMKSGFNSQCKKIRSGAYPIPDEYRDIIINDMVWYWDVHLIRSNMNHFLIGDYNIKKTEGGEWIFMYENLNKSPREFHSDDKKFINRNIIEDIDNFDKYLFLVLQKIFLVYLHKAGTTNKAHILKYTKDGCNIHEMNFLEYIKQEKGVIIENIY
jgi:hypothetical protein